MTYSCTGILELHENACDCLLTAWHTHVYDCMTYDAHSDLRRAAHSNMRQLQILFLLHLLFLVVMHSG